MLCVATCSHYASTPKHVQALQIQEVHPAMFQCMQFLPFLSIFHTCPIYYRPSFTSRTPDKDHKIEQLFFLLLSPGEGHELHSECFCACCLQALTKSASRKSGAFRLAWTYSHDSTIWAWNEVFRPVVPASKTRKSQHNCLVFLYVFSMCMECLTTFVKNAW